MDEPVARDECNRELLHAYLEAALIEADKCDPIVAIHIETAIATFRERFAPPT